MGSNSNAKGDCNGLIDSSPKTEDRGISQLKVAAMPGYTAEYYDRSHGPLYRWDQKRPRASKRRVTIPEKVTPVIRLVFAEMRRRQIRYDDLEIAAGVRRATMKAWRKKNRPGLESLEAVLGCLGWSFTPTPANDALPTDIAADLAALSDKLGKAMPETWAALISFGVNQQIARERSSAILAKIDEARSAPPDQPRQAQRQRVH